MLRYRCHPDNLGYAKVLAQASKEQFIPRPERAIVLDSELPKAKWLPPKGSRFVEYDENDECWMPYFNLGFTKPLILREDIRTGVCYDAEGKIVRI